MKKSLFLFPAIAVIFFGCKKTYTCECFNPGGVFKSYQIKSSKKQATDKCEAHAKEYQTVPMSETACNIKD